MESTANALLDNLFVKYKEHNKEKYILVTFELIKNYIMHDIENYMKNDVIDTYEKLDYIQSTYITHINYNLSKYVDIDINGIFNIFYDYLIDIDYITYKIKDKVFDELLRVSLQDIIKLNNKRKLFVRYSLLKIYDNLDKSSKYMPNYLSIILKEDINVKIEETYLYSAMSSILKGYDKDLSQMYLDMV